MTGCGAKGSDGFTLIEVIIVVVILGIITVPVTGVVIAFLRNTDATNAELSESRDAQITAAYWAQDVASVGRRSTTDPYPFTQSVELGPAYNVGLSPCGVVGTPNALVRLSWDDYAGPTTPVLVRVAYVVVATSGRSELHRIRCNGSAVPASDVALARDLDPATPPTVVCSTTCTASGSLPATATLTLALKDPKNAQGSYVVTYTGQRRQSS